MKIIIKVLIVIFISIWVYGIFNYLESQKVEEYIEDNCTMNSQVNNCIVISTVK